MKLTNYHKNDIKFCMPLLQKPDMIFFDVGLVLIDPCGIRLSNMIESLTNHKIPPEKLIVAYRQTIKLRDSNTDNDKHFDFWHNWCAYLNIDLSQTQAISNAVAILEHDEQKLWFRPNPEAQMVLKAIANLGIRIGVISNADGELKKDLERTQLLRYVEFSLDSHLFGMEKPEPQIFQAALKCTDLKPEQSWMVGDDLTNDIRPAQALGFAAAILFDPLGIYNDIHGFYKISYLSDLIPLIKKL